eukprot:g4065.t1
MATIAEDAARGGAEGTAPEQRISRSVIKNARLIAACVASPRQQSPAGSSPAQRRSKRNDIISRSDLREFFRECSLCFGQESSGEMEAEQLLVKIGTHQDEGHPDELCTTVGDFSEFLTQKFSAFPEHLKEIKQVVAEKLRPRRHAAAAAAAELHLGGEGQSALEGANFSKLSSWQAGKSQAVAARDLEGRAEASSPGGEPGVVQPAVQPKSPLKERSESPEVAAVRKEMQAKIDALQEKIATKNGDMDAIRREMQSKIDALESQMQENLKCHHRMLKNILCASKERENAAVADAVHRTKMEIRARLQARRSQHQFHQQRKQQAVALPPPAPAPPTHGKENILPLHLKKSQRTKRERKVQQRRERKTPKKEKKGRALQHAGNCLEL